MADEIKAAGIEKFDGTDFGYWKMQIEDYLYGKKLHLPLLGSKPEKMEAEEWQLLDRQVLGIIRLSLSRRVAHNVTKEKSTAKLMEALSGMYEKPSANNKVHLMKKLFNLKMVENTSKCEGKTRVKVQAQDQLSTSTLEGGDTIEAHPEADQNPDTEELHKTKKPEADSANATTDEVQDALILAVQSQIDEWILDSGASFHCTPHNEMLQNYVGGDHGVVYLADGTPLKIVGIGDVQIKTMNGSIWTLQNVRHVPELKKKLISVGQLDDSGHSILFAGGMWKVSKGAMENMLEVDCPCVTPEVVLKASGHVDKFTDLMVKDEKTGTCYRADHLLKDFCNEKIQKDLSISAEKAAELKHVLAVLDDLSAEELGAKIKEYGITAPDTKNPLSDPYPFNLMFQTSIGPSGLSPGYMRPETAQGIFVNFKDLYYYNGNKLPFAAAQIGQAFRNEISPRQGLLRVREFTLAEIEHFVDPDDKSHPKYSEVADLEFLMFPREQQVSGQSAKKIRLGEAVSKGIVNNETLGYFIGRVYLFLTHLGIDKDRLRFRQHLANEMAHYAADCWDAEIESSYGWIECVGIADRSAYDLRAHTDKSGVPLVAHEKFSEPKEVEELVIAPVKKELGLSFKGNQKKSG
uniref:glycine--tRNA ligase n=1 Tax=Populus alba TaxID=43335 RepID=A0A4U5NLQ9_POPAL|nr:Glycyl-tRNA synthetase family protein [Populus alba]